MRSRGALSPTIWLAGLGIAVLLALVLARIWLLPLIPSNADQALGTLSLRPSVGINVSSAKIYDQPMAYALYASSAAKLGKVSDARAAADWLVGHTAAPNKSGWGLPVPWDAFGDGSVNPASTVYGITDALAVNALLDVYDATKDARYLNAAHAALSEYAAYFKPTARRQLS